MRNEALLRVNRGSPQRGSIYVLVVVFGVLFAAIIVSLQLAVSSQDQMNRGGEVLTRRMLLADCGAAKGKAHVLLNHNTLKVGTPPASSPTTIINETMAGGRDSLVVTAQHISGTSYPYVFRIVSTGTIFNEWRRVEIYMEVDQPVPPSISLPWVGAVVAAGDIEVKGNITIDGRDHDAAGAYNAGGTHVPGTLTTGLVDTSGGSEQIGGKDSSGNPAAPVSDPGPPIEAENTGLFNPEVNTSDGVDNNGNGLMDENGFPKSPAEFFKVNPLNATPPTNADLKARAVADGTYFTTVAAYETYLSSHTADEKGGKIFYVEIANVPAVPPGSTTVLGNFSLPNNPPPARPSMVIVQHKEVVDDESGPNPPPDRDGDGKTIQHNIEIGPVHVEGGGSGTFQGLLFCDHVKNINGTGTVVGAIVAFNGLNLDNTTDPADAKFGNGNHKILFSSEVLGNLPGGGTPPAGRLSSILLWRESR